MTTPTQYRRRLRMIHIAALLTALAFIAADPMNAFSGGHRDCQTTEGMC